MRHQLGNRKLGRTSGHRAALFRNQIASMIEHGRIVTTLPKAKELRPLVEKMVTLGKNDTVHNRRQAARSISENNLVQKLFTDISPRFSERPGGYTRIVKMGPRRGDGAEMAILEFVDFSGNGAAEAAPAAPAKGAKKAAPAKQSTADAAEGASKKRTAKAKSDDAAAGEEKPKRTRKKKEDAE